MNYHLIIVMRRYIITLLALVAFSLTIHGQLLYKISGNGLKKPSYLLGTYHFAASSFTDSIPGFHKAMGEAEQACGEIEMDLMKRPEVLVKLQKAMMLPDGVTLASLLNKEEMDALNMSLKNLLGADLTNPMVNAQMGKMNPAAINLQLVSLMYLKHDPTFNLDDGIDAYVQTLAKKGKKPVLSFETVDEQIDVLFGKQTIERQKVLLMCLVNNQEYMMNITDHIVAAYYSQDLNKIEELEDVKTNDQCDPTEEENDALVYGRNAKWMTKIPDIMKSKSTFFAVGAAHLVGEKGLLSLLSKAGYKVEPCK